MSNDTPLVIRENIPAKTHSFVAAAHEPTPPVPTFPYPPHLIPYPGPSPGPYGYPPFFNLPFMLGGGAIDKKPNGEKAPEENSVEEPGDLDRQHVGDFTDDASNETTLNPCVDIKASSGLISALELRNSTNVSGTFAFSKTVEDAPVPGLRIKNLGSLPVPLTTKSAQELINVCELAPFGRGEKTVVDRTVRDTWELSADKVAFDNPRWDIWFQSTVVPEITQRLGIPCAATWELYKLLVYEKGSHFLAHQEFVLELFITSYHVSHLELSTEKSDGMFATVVIVLPTIFEGGQLHMSHSNQAKIFDVSENSAFGTSFMAWYTDVRHEVKPITSGYRLALSYNLVAPIGVARPALSDCSRSVEAVRKVLLTWKDNFSPSTPNKLAYLLDHKYSSVGLKNRILKGSDVQKVDILHTLAKEHGFEVYLAKVELKVVGEAACQRKYHDMGEIISVDLKFEEIVNLDGERVELKSSAMKFDHPCDFIPHALDQGPPDEEENEGYMGNAAGHVEYWYKQTAILIWPRNRREAVFGVDWLKDAAGQLKGLASTSPSEAEKKLIEDMLFRLERGAISDEASRAICTAAVRWRDRDLWLHAAHIGEVEVRMSVLSHEDLIEAAHAFGFEKLQDILASILAKSTSNAYCLKLIAKISDSDLSCNEAGRGWCDSQREIALQNLHVPTIDDVNPLLEVIITYGIQIAQKTIIPQLLALQCAQDFWFSFLKAIYSHRQTIAPSAQATHDATKTTLRTLLEKTNPLQVKRPAHLFDKSCDYDAQVIIDLLAVSFELGSPELCDIVLQKLNDEVNGAKNASEGAPILNLYRPILKSIDNFSKIHSVNLNTPPMTVVLEMVTTRVIDHDMEREKPDWQAAIEAAKMCGNKGVCILESRLLPHLEHAKSSSGIYSQVAKTLKDTWPVDSTTEHPVLLTTLITKLVTLAISKAEILFRPSPTNLSHPDYVKTATRLLRLCLKTNNAHLALSLLSRLKSPETHFQTHFLKVAIPFITSLCHELTPRNIPVASEPYSTFCRETLIIFVDKILGHRPVYNALMPRDVFESVDCGCQTCKQMVNQLVLPDTTVTMRRNAYDRKHMEQRIISKLGLVFRTVQGSSPYGLMITKPTWLTAIGIWNERRQIGYNALVAINSTQSLDAILGEDFPKILGILEVELPRASSAESGMPMPEGVTSSSISSAFSSYPQATFPQILAQSQPHQGSYLKSVYIRIPSSVSLAFYLATPSFASGSGDSRVSGIPGIVYTSSPTYLVMKTEWLQSLHGEKGGLEGENTRAELGSTNRHSSEEVKDKSKGACEDIKAGLSAALEPITKSGFGGTFACSETFKVAPLPGLRISGIGRISLPMTENTARECIKLCDSLVPGATSVARRNIWELTPDKILLENSYWDVWMKTSVLPQVAQQLGIARIASWQLSKLILCGNGSRTSDGTIKPSNEAFATIVVILPSTFEGGQLHVSHSGLTKVFDVAKNSTFSTSVVASYSDTHHELQTISAGYRLALFYDLVAPANTPRPNLSAYSQAAKATRRVLMSWGQTFHDHTPTKLAYVLDHKFCKVSSTSNKVLTGTDTSKVDILRSVAEGCQFRMYLAKVKLKETGRSRRYDSYNMDEVEYDNLTITDVVDSRGKAVDFPINQLHYQHPEEFVPHSLSDGEPDEEDYEYRNYDDYSHYVEYEVGGRQIEFGYIKTVVLLWPINRDEFVLENYWLDVISPQLQNPPSTIPMHKQLNMVTRVLSCLERGSIHWDASHEVCMKALEWKDWTIFLRLIKIRGFACRVPEFLSNHELIELAIVFGFERFCGLLNDVLKNSRSNAYIFDLIQSIQDSGLSARREVELWCEEKRDGAIRNLKCPIVADLDVLMGIFRSQGISFAEATVIPQLLTSKADQDFWIAFLDKLYLFCKTIVPSSAHDNTKDVVKATLTSYLGLLDVGQRVWRSQMFTKSDQERYDPKPIIELIKLCVRLQAPEACELIFRKLTEWISKRQLARQNSTWFYSKPPSEPLLRPVLLEIFALSQLPHSINLRLPSFRDFLHAALGELIEEGMKDLYSHWKRVIEVAKWCGGEGAAILGTKLVQHFDQSTTDGDFSNTNPSAIAERILQDWTFDPNTEEGVAVRKLIQDLVIYASSKKPLVHLHDAERILHLCFRIDSTECFSSLFSHLTIPKKNMHEHFTYVVMSIVAILQRELTTRNIPRRQDPYRPFCRDVIVLFATQILGPRPLEEDAAVLARQIVDIHCSCDLCIETKQKLALHHATVIVRAPDTDDLRHVQEQFEARLGLTCQIVYDHYPYGLQITKPASLTAFSVWTARKAALLSALNAMGPTESQLEVLGDDLAWISDMIHDATSNDTASPSTVLHSVGEQIAIPMLASGPGAGSKRKSPFDLIAEVTESRLDDPDSYSRITIVALMASTTHKDQSFPTPVDIQTSGYPAPLSQPEPTKPLLEQAGSFLRTLTQADYNALAHYTIGNDEEDEEVEEEYDHGDEEYGEDGGYEGPDNQDDDDAGDLFEDIGEALTSALATKPTSGIIGTFAFSKTVEDAPIPGLNIDGLGRVPIPLTERGAQELIGVCDLAPFGKGERTVVDKSVRDTWELAADKISFHNPRWHSWVESTVIPEISERLGVTSTVIHCEIRALQAPGIREGIPQLPSPSGTKGMFGTFVIVLPILFEGGQLHLSHSGQTKIFESSINSEFSTSILAWYTDVRHEVKPITSGYRLALSYNLITPTGIPRLRLSDSSAVVLAVRGVLDSWRQNVYRGPSRLAYVLSHKYSSFGIGSGVLKGSDVQIVDVLRSLADECGFRVYLAKAELYVKGTEDEPYQSSWRRVRDDACMGEITEEKMTIQDVIDLDGNPMNFVGLKFNHPKDFIPRALNKGPPDKQESTGYMGNYAGDVEHWYNQTVVLIWPEQRHEEVLGNNWLKDVACTLKRSASTSPTDGEKVLTSRMIIRLQAGVASDIACHELCTAALRWQDFDLWLRAVNLGKTAGRSLVLTHPELVHSAATFGFDKVKSFLSTTIKQIPSNAQRLSLITAFSDAELSKDPDVRTWCEEQRDIVFTTLKTVNVKDVELLTAACVSKVVLQKRIFNIAKYRISYHIILQSDMICDISILILEVIMI
ncbi:hypothetical protein SISSUDRAFT_1064684 [Sistotremastrum suecicum HHB10207 ss-3]|uniref:Prolyl 4-hydroxylase alpha subunit Fe(2+) 2OG dioxygenase domain-containing protein n=1 Tax=Sistotremastrum suecicum HHB10207 ss-3 TaxID=1314776 RepID=A0A166ABK2_9AGAM|nr:hypothetical protein SISSUDRAFT_1064684 [Sistotremastrum suecicum HHB10207 ss-3]